MDTQLVKPKAAAKMLGMSVPWVYKAAAKGILPHVVLPSLGATTKAPIRFKLEDLREFIHRHHVSAATRQGRRSWW
jgi:predicted DNA-binding transcriptional regulator AlpA